MTASPIRSVLQILLLLETEMEKKRNVISICLIKRMQALLSLEGIYW